LSTKIQEKRIGMEVLKNHIWYSRDIMEQRRARELESLGAGD
jgi:hypothetical protein